MKKNKAPLILCIIICLALLVSICSFTIGQNQEAILTSMGEQSQKTTPGLHFKMPWPFQKVSIIDTNRQIYVGARRDIPTKDEIRLISELSASWRVSDSLLFHNAMGNLATAKKILQSNIESTQESVMRSTRLGQLFELGGLAKIEAEILVQLNKNTVEKYGITFDFCGLTNISVHSKNSEGILKRMQQERIKQASIIRSKAEADAKIIRNNADTKKAKIIAEAAGEARRKEGTSLVAITAEYEKHLDYKDFIIFLKKLDALGDVMRYDTTLFLDPNSPIYDVLASPAAIEAPKSDK